MLINDKYLRLWSDAAHHARHLVRTYDICSAVRSFFRRRRHKYVLVYLLCFCLFYLYTLSLCAFCLVQFFLCLFVVALLSAKPSRTKSAMSYSQRHAMRKAGNTRGTLTLGLSLLSTLRDNFTCHFTHNFSKKLIAFTHFPFFPI